MNYIKAKYPNSNRSYTYRTEDTVSAGDTVVTDKGAKLTVVGEADMAWVETYGADKLAVVKKYEEIKEYRIIDILDSKTKEPRKDGKYPLRIGRIVKEPKPHIGMPMFLEYLRNADGTDYSGYTLRTSRVTDVCEKVGILEIETMNSIYVFEPAVAGESEEN